MLHSASRHRVLNQLRSNSLFITKLFTTTDAKQASAPACNHPTCATVAISRLPLRVLPSKRESRTATHVQRTKCVVQRHAARDTTGDHSEASTRAFPLSPWTDARSMTMTQRRGRLVVHVRLAIYHEFVKNATEVGKEVRQCWRRYVGCCVTSHP